ELLQILLDLCGRNVGGRRERRLRAAKRRVGHAGRLVTRINRRARKRDGRSQPPPDGGDRAQRQNEQRQRYTKRNRFPPPSAAVLTFVKGARRDVIRMSEPGLGGTRRLARKPAICQGPCALRLLQRCYHTKR